MISHVDSHKLAPTFALDDSLSLAFMGGRANTEGRTVEQQVLESNPVMEAFGNAKTVKNNNSSRFGKFVEIQFDMEGKISGAAIRTYLLERSRVCQLSDPERNYHCFYMLCAAPPEELERFKLGDPRSYHYLNQSNCYHVANVDDAREYLETRHAMDVVGISVEDQDAIFRVVAAILHLGNVEFAKGKEIDSSKLKNDKSTWHLETAADLLMCDKKSLEASLCKRVIVTPDGNITKPLDPGSAALSRDALAKTIYSRLFDWIVDTINNSIGQDSNAKSLIGVLDIYGFESFKVNSFEQLCINLTNEKLQQHFNQHVFKMEQEEYTKEEINWSYVEFVDNQDVLDLIEKKPGGIIALLDEACMFPKATYETFVQKMYQTYKANKRFSKPKLARTDFTINHYAGDVTYQADLFLDKNKDYVVAEHQALLNNSKCSFVSNLFPPLQEETMKQSKFSSIGTRFKQQLQLLMETLSTTEPHYIRCVKPNTVLKPGIFENYNVLNQLRCGGVLEAIRISCAGYPTKRTFEEFLFRFGMLTPDVLDWSDEKAACAAILDRMGLKGYQIGKTKVFLRAGQMAELDARRAEILANAAKRIQMKIRTYHARKEFISLRNATIDIQKLWRGKKARKLYEFMRMERAAICIQKNSRAFMETKKYQNLKRSAFVIQTGLRAMAARDEYRHRRKTKAVTMFQKIWRKYMAISAFRDKKKATISLQSLWRARVARKELRKLKMAARETGALKEAKDKLEKKVEELQWRLDFEKHLRVELEEAKAQEICMLQNTLQETQKLVEETRADAIREKEAAILAIQEAPPIIKEVPVIDNTRLEELKNQNSELEGMLEDMQNKIFKLEKENEAALKESEIASQNIVQLQDKIDKLEINLSTLESESQVLRQQALVTPTTDELLDELSSLKAKIQELESENEELRKQPAVYTTVAYEAAPLETAGKRELVSREPDEPQTKNYTNGNVTVEDLQTPKDSVTVHQLIRQKSLPERQQDNIDALIKCLIEDKRYDAGIPVAACALYKALLHWRCFEAEKSSTFDKIIHSIRSSFESQANTQELSYWLSATSTLLYLLQTTLKTNNIRNSYSRRHRTSASILFANVAQSFKTSFMELGTSSGYSGMVETANELKVEAKYPALLFKQHLTACVEKLYGLLRDGIRKDISPFLNLCIQAPRTMRLRSLKASTKNMLSSIVSKQQNPNIHWQSIVMKLEDNLNVLKENYVPSVLISKIFSQVCYFINVHLFNSLLLRRESCCFSNGEYVKAGLQELHQWCKNASEKFSGTSWDELQHIWQAVGFLVLHQKSQLSLDEITNELCPILSIQQIYRIGTMFWDDKYGTHGLSDNVITRLRALAAGEESISTSNNTFLLEADASIPFTIEEMLESFVLISVSEVPPPQLLRQKSDFMFLFQAASATE